MKLKRVKIEDVFLKNDYSKERKNLKDMQLGLDLTKDKDDKYMMKKIIEYLKEKLNYNFSNKI